MERCLAYHTILMSEDEELDIEVVHDIIVNSGFIYSADLLPPYDSEYRYSPSYYATDILAGDTKYVFLSVSSPISGLRKSSGLSFVFDAVDLVTELGAIVGVKDLDDEYWMLADGLAGHTNLSMDNPDDWDDGIVQDFLTGSRRIKDKYRLSGEAAISWLEFVCYDVGPTSFQLPSGVPTSASDAVKSCEILVPYKLPMSMCIDIIKRK